jgi:hypothetical protein
MQDDEIPRRATVHATRIDTLADGARPLQHIDMIGAFLRCPSDERYSTALDNVPSSLDIGGGHVAKMASW